MPYIVIPFPSEARNCHLQLSWSLCDSAQTAQIVTCYFAWGRNLLFFKGTKSTTTVGREVRMRKFKIGFMCFLATLLVAFVAGCGQETVTLPGVVTVVLMATPTAP